MKLPRATLPPPVLARLLAAAALVAVCAPGAGLAADPPEPTQALRRTRVVEVFENWKESVVFVTGPVIKSEKPSTDEFFAIDRTLPKERGVGTGFVIHGSGYILTNAHGVERILAHVVVLADRKSYPAELLAVVHSQDLALLKVVGAPPLKPVRLARSDDLLIGETVIVVAHPHGLLHTCTAGVLSAIGRTSHLSDMPGVILQNMIQSDAGINPGSSGGPWFNAAGEVMGMTASMKRDAENIAFAVSAATLRRLLPGMLDVERRYGLVTGLEVSTDGPCEVIKVQPDSPAAAAGVRPQDLIYRFGNVPTPTSLDFHLALIGRKPEQKVSVQLLSGGKPREVTLTLGRRPTPDVQAILKRKLGLEAAPLDPAKAKAMGLRVPRGFVVTAVEPGMYDKVQHPPQPGDVVARIGYIRPRSPEHAAELVEPLQGGQAVDLVLLRRQETTATRIDIHLVLPR